MNLLSAKEIAVHLSVSEWTVKRAYRTGIIPGERLGKLLRFDLSEVRDAMRQNGRADQEHNGTRHARIGDSRPRSRTVQKQSSQSARAKGKTRRMGS